MNLYPIYKCENFEFENGLLTIYSPEVIALVGNKDDFNTIAYASSYNAVVCPNLYEDENGKKVLMVVFK